MNKIRVDLSNALNPRSIPAAGRGSRDLVSLDTRLWRARGRLRLAGEYKAAGVDIAKEDEWRDGLALA